MADLSKIKLNGTTYDLKDISAREVTDNIAIIQQQITCSDDILDPGETITLSDYTYITLDALATQNKKFVILILKIQYDRASEIRYYLLHTNGGNVRSGKFQDLLDPNTYWSYGSTTLTLDEQPVLTYCDTSDPLEPEDDEDVEDMLDTFELDYTSNSIDVNQWQGGSY